MLRFGRGAIKGDDGLRLGVEEGDAGTETGTANAEIDVGLATPGPVSAGALEESLLVLRRDGVVDFFDPDF